MAPAPVQTTLEHALSEELLLSSSVQASAEPVLVTTMALLGPAAQKPRARVPGRRGAGL
jgi:hypothetical protein